MANDAGGRMKVVIYYAVWATLCAAAAGVAISFIHTWFFSYNPGRSWVVHTLVSDLVAAVLLAAGQGAGALDFVMDFVQMAVPATELGWVPDILILAAVTIAITALGSRASAA